MVDNGMKVLAVSRSSAVESKKGFTLVELMVVVLIVGILAAVALPLMSGRIDAAKWSEARAAAGTIATATRVFVAEQGAGYTGSPTLEQIGMDTTDLNGTYFVTACYSLSAVTAGANGPTFTVTVDSAASTRTTKPTSSPTTRYMYVINGVTTAGTDNI
jgi:prepilin-type N-terminal cleavage/methylation domain-containing protein